MIKNFLFNFKILKERFFNRFKDEYFELKLFIDIRNFIFLIFFIILINIFKLLNIIFFVSLSLINLGDILYLFIKLVIFFIKLFLYK